MSHLSKKSLFGLSLASLTIVSAQAYRLNIRVIDPDGEPEIYATARVFLANDSAEVPHVVAGQLTDSLSRATINIADPGEYRLSLEAAGRAPIDTLFSVNDTAPDIDLGTLKLDEGANELGEIVVTAQKPLVVKDIDRIGYDVQADPETPTSTTQDILKKVPMVSVDAEGNITINGSSNFLIYKNGKPNKTMSSNAKEIFAAIPASMIQKIEVITEPGAKYDAEGVNAILNIVTVNNSSMKGVLGNVSLNFNTNNLAPGANIWLTSQVGKVNFSVNAGQGFNTRRKRNTATNVSDYEYTNGTKFKSEGSSLNDGFYNFVGGELSWEADSLNLFTAEFNGFYGNFNSISEGHLSMTDASGQIFSAYNSKQYTPTMNFANYSANASYQHNTHREDETLIFNYQISYDREHISSRDEYSDIVGDFFDYTSDYSLDRSHELEHTLQFDWHRPFGDVHTLETGAKYISRTNTSEGTMEHDDVVYSNTDFKHTQDILALYGQYTAKIKKVSLRAGLRYEYTRMNAKFRDGSADDYAASLNDLCPSAAASWNINDANSLSATYSATINRPGITYLSPATTTTTTSESSGNPNLESSRDNNLKLTYTYMKPKFNLNLALSHTFNNNSIANVTSLNDETNMLYKTYENIAHSRTSAVNLYIQWRATNKTRFQLNAHADYAKIKQEGLSLGRPKGYFWGSISQDLPYNLSADLSCWCFMSGLSSIYSYTSQKFWNALNPSIGIRGQFLKDKRLTVRLNWNHFIGNTTSTRTTRYVNGSYIGSSITKSPNYQSLSVSVSYKFGSFKGFVKKTDVSIENNDIVGGSQKGQSSGQ
jgi:outer membrane receptor protein involved in Fe transport